MGFSMNGNIVALSFMSLGKIIAGVLNILLLENVYSKAIDQSKPNNSICFSKQLVIHLTSLHYQKWIITLDKRI